MNQKLQQLKIETLEPGKRYKLARSSSTGNLPIYNDFIYNDDLLSPLSPAIPIGRLYVGDIVVFLNKVKLALASAYYATRILTTTGEIGWIMCGHSLEEV